MRRRITEAIVGVVAVVLLVLGLALALVAHRSILNAEIVREERTASRTLAEINLPLSRDQLASIQTEPDAPLPFAVYDGNGNLLFGDGPSPPDEAARRALTGVVASTTTDRIVVAMPIVDRPSERITGAVRLEESLATVNHQTRRAWLIIGAAAALALAFAGLMAHRLAKGLSRPVTDLALAASRIGVSGTAENLDRSGVAETDALAAALETSSRRVSEALARERRFSADVSHQLRTPLTGIRLRLEAARAGLGTADLDVALDDLGRLENTIDHLLAFARDATPVTATVRLDEAAATATARWAQRSAEAQRAIRTGAAGPVTVAGSPASVGQILDVLIDNALRHGHGDILLDVRHLPGGGAIDVADDGTALSPLDAERIFRRGEGQRNGIGLALARSMAEADGGRLLLSRYRPTTFSLILLGTGRES
jgi:signal transduction histidine kinase